MTKKTSEVMKVKKVLLAASLFLGLAVKSYAGVDQVCINGGNCPGVNNVVSQSTPVFTAIQFVDGTTQTTAGGSGGGGGGSGAALVLRMGNTFTTISTAIASGNLDFQIISGTGVFKVDLSSYAQTMASTTWSGSLKLTNGTTIQTVSGPALRLISNDAYPIPLYIGNNAAGTLTGFCFQNGGVSTGACLGFNENSKTMTFGLGSGAVNKEWMTYSGAAGGGLGINQISPTSVLHISSASGATNSLLLVSTGGFKVFEVFGSSVVSYVPVISRYGVEYSTSSSGSSGSTPDNGFTLAQSTINSRLDGLTAGASFYVKNSSTPSGAVFSVSSATVISTFTAGNIITGQLSVSGTAGTMTGTNGVITVTGDLSFATTWYTGVAFPVSVGSVGMQNSINFSTNNLNGRAYYDGTAAGSAPTNASFYQKSIPQTFVAGTTPTLTRFVDFSTGVTTQGRAYIISFATAAQHEQSQNLVYTSTVVYIVSGNTPAAGGAVTTRTKITLPSVGNMLGSGDCVLWIRVARDGDNTVSDPAQSNSVLIDVGLNFKIQL